MTCTVCTTGFEHGILTTDHASSYGIPVLIIARPRTIGDLEDQFAFRPELSHLYDRPISPIEAAESGLMLHESTCMPFSLVPEQLVPEQIAAAKILAKAFNAAGDHIRQAQHEAMEAKIKKYESDLQAFYREMGWEA